MGSATVQVLETTELLELVLSFATPPDLLRALRRCLYFHPDPHSAEAYGLNPFFMQRFALRRDAGDGMILYMSSKPQWLHRLSASAASASWRRMLVAQPPEPFRIDEGSRQAYCGFGADVRCGDAWDTYYDLSKTFKPQRTSL
ncbi:hypothetical protein SLS58_007953 [Diplodia intermedia]|uniref:F-box domain-containing protein n=1 Tax=Diplodia intermedia TaxID=856260 RepID=A0ABR3TJF7_9PEZI